MSEATTACQHLRITTVYPINLPTPVHICGECGVRLTDKIARAEDITRDDMNVNLGLAICRALQIDATRVTALKLEMVPKCPPILEISRVILGDDHEALRKVLEKYRLTPIESDPQVDSQASTGSN